jgi:hypothetical protein
MPMATALTVDMPRRWAVAVAGALLLSLLTAGWMAPAPAQAAVSASAASSAQSVVVTRARSSELGHRTLRRGHRGKDVQKLQKLLLVIQTGYFGPLTAAAVRRVERRYGLKADAVVDSRTLSAIRKNAKARTHRAKAKSQRKPRVSRGESRFGSPAAAKRYARAYIKDAYGWNSRQMSCLTLMWERESNWNYRASNPNGRYHGIPQTSSAVWQAHGYSRAEYMGSAAVQIKVGTRYIKGRYGSPCKAWSFWKSHHWY